MYVCVCILNIYAYIITIISTYRWVQKQYGPVGFNLHHYAQLWHIETDIPSKPIWSGLGLSMVIFYTRVRRFSCVVLGRDSR